MYNSYVGIELTATERAEMMDEARSRADSIAEDLYAETGDWFEFEFLNGPFGPVEVWTDGILVDRMDSLDDSDSLIDWTREEQP